MGNANSSTGIITVPHTGVYRITLHGTAYNTRTTYTWFYPTIWLLVNNTSINASNESFHHPQMIRSLGALEFGCVYLYPLAAGDELKLGLGRLSSTYAGDANQYTNTSLLVEYMK
jgi:hypothetical protein